ncbi:VOC family protein [Pseudonocardia spinosispora]|uniref:VOC family protein n=1 Tax=Pseudonocardia spinosispora TaxID=103441 RepID=UPI000425DFD8|nr:VOC family protein [Pseudonocardia spinosispora]
MSSRVLAVALDCQDVDRVAAFWCGVFSSTVLGRWTDARGKEYVELGMGEPDGGPVMVLQPTDGTGRTKNRVHLDLAPAQLSQADEVARLVELGATVLADESDMPWVVLADPEGNEFCVLPPPDPSA